MTRNTYRTKTGRTLTDHDIHKLADAIAHPDYQPTTRKRGRRRVGVESSLERVTQTHTTAHWAPDQPR